jgi:hypothetical protein
MEMSIIEKLEEYKDSESVDYLESALEDLREVEKEQGLTMEAITKATQSLDLVRGDLLSALSHSTPAEAILIQQALDSLAKTDNLVASIKNAIEAKE